MQAIRNERYLDELRQVGLDKGHHNEGSISSRQNPVDVDDVWVVRSQAQCLYLSLNVFILKKQKKDNKWGKCGNERAKRRAGGIGEDTERQGWPRLPGSSLAARKFGSIV